MDFRRIAIFGASGGFGNSLVEAVGQKFSVESMWLHYRKTKLQFEQSSDKIFYQADLSHSQSWGECIVALETFEPDLILFCVGGGPYGVFQDKELKDHQWALRVSFEFPMFLIHWFLVYSMKKASRAVFTGSSVAEMSGDPFAASYCAAKHALRGLVSSIAEEQPESQVYLFSPGYMNTKLLPPNSHPRHQESAIWQPSELATKLIDWIAGENPQWQLVLPKYQVAENSPPM